MKRQFVLPALFALVCAFATRQTSAQTPDDDRQKDFKTEAVLKAGGKAATEVGKATVKVGAAGAKALGEKVVIPAAKLLWDPVLTKAAPKVVGKVLSLLEKGSKTDSS